MTELAAKMIETVAERISSDKPDTDARHAIVGALGVLTKSYYAAGKKTVRVADLSDLLIEIGESLQS